MAIKPFDYTPSNIEVTCVAQELVVPLLKDPDLDLVDFLVQDEVIETIKNLVLASDVPTTLKQRTEIRGQLIQYFDLEEKARNKLIGEEFSRQEEAAEEAGMAQAFQFVNSKAYLYG